MGFVVGQKTKKGKDTLLLMRMPRLLLLGMLLVLKKARLEMREIEKTRRRGMTPSIAITWKAILRLQKK